MAVIRQDSNGRICGIDTGVEDFKFLYFPMLDSFNRTLCVKDCPVMAISSDETSNTDGAPGWKQLIYAPTRKAVSASVKPYTSAYFAAQNYSSTDTRKATIYQSFALLDKFCVPIDRQFFSKNGYETERDIQFSTDPIKDLSGLKPRYSAILSSVGIAFIVALLFIVLLRNFAGLLTQICILGYFICIIGIAVILLFHKQDKGGAVSLLVSDNKELIISVMFAFAGLSGIIFLCLLKKIKQAIAIIKSAALFVAEVKPVFFVSLILALCNILFFAWWIVTFAYLYTIGDVTSSLSVPLAFITHKAEVFNMLIYHFFSGLWIIFFFRAMNQFIVSTDCALWYLKKPNEPKMPVSKIIKRSLTSNFGSLALAAGFVFNNNVITRIALLGKNYFSSAIGVFKLIVCNPFKFGIIFFISGIINIFSRLFIAGVSGLIWYIIFFIQTYFMKDHTMDLFPTIIDGIIGFLIGSFFMDLYGTGVDTILQCVCLDEKLMKKTNQIPDRCPGPLRNYYIKYAKK